MEVGDLCWDIVTESLWIVTDIWWNGLGECYKYDLTSVTCGATIVANDGGRYEKKTTTEDRRFGLSVLQYKYHRYSYRDIGLDNHKVSLQGKMAQRSREHLEQTKWYKLRSLLR